MEYGSKICNDQFMRYVGYNYTPDSWVEKLFSKENIKKISSKITELLQGVDKYNRRIIIPDDSICHVLSSIYENFRPETGDIYTRYNIPKRGGDDYEKRIIDQVINVITTDVKVNYGMIEANEKLSKWTTVLGDFNKHQLRSHPPIKIRERRPQPMAFQMNY